jgi:predicted ATPase
LEVGDLLQISPGLKVLVTSRVALHLRGERGERILPLALPPVTEPTPRHRASRHTPEQLTAYPAVALFLQRVQDTQPAFRLTAATAPAVAAICVRLDGLPLALELAAVRVKLLSPSALLQRLERSLPLLTGGARDLEARQQTMRNTLAWSEDLLESEARRLFRRLAVFVGGFTLEAAEAVCTAPEGAEPLGLAVVDGLAALVDQSLVQRWSVGQDGTEHEGETDGEARFRLLYVVREYALERLEACVETEALRRAHAVYSLGLVEERALAGFGPEGGAWLGQLEREHDNFRAALAWARERGETELGLRLAASLGPFWYSKGHYTEGRGWVEGLLALASRPAGAAARERNDGEAGTLCAAGVSPVARAKALSSAANFAWVQGDNERTQAAAAEALVLARGQQAGWAEGVALEMLGVVAWGRGDLKQATAYLEESVTQLREVGEPWLAASYLTFVGDIARVRGDLEQAAACCEESLAFARRTGADHPAGSALRGLAEVARLQGDLARAEVLGRERLLAARRLGSPAYLAAGLEELARTAAAASGERARIKRAARLLGVAAALRERVGAAQRPQERADTEQALAEPRMTLGEEAWAAAFAAGQALSLEEAIAEALGEKSG